MPVLINAAGLALLAYALGSVPFGVLIGRLVVGRDVRAAGSGHTGATNVFRQAGVPAAILVALLDVAKGFAAAWIARRWAAADWVVALAAAAVVGGHCWPFMAGFRGGMGLSAAGGALLAIYPFGFVVGLGLVAGGTLVLRHSARGNFAAGVLVGPALWLLAAPQSIVLAATGAGLVVAARSLSDWSRVYREVWLDRGPPADST